MKYMGSKRRIAKYILPIMIEKAKEENKTTWIEPFVGGANMIDKVPNNFKRIGVDLNPHTIYSLIDIRDNINSLPDKVTEEEYKQLKEAEPKSITSWIRFMLSFGGKFDNGYAREKGSDEYTFCGYGKRNAIKQSPLIQDVDFLIGSYDKLEIPNDSIIYCDPPYKDTCGYKTEYFDHEKFYDWCRQMKQKGHTIFISEYSMPDDFIEVWRGEIKTNFASSRKKATHNAVEKLFTL